MILLTFLTFVFCRDTQLTCEIENIRVIVAEYYYLSGYVATVGDCESRNGTFNVPRKSDLSFDCGFSLRRSRLKMRNLTMITFDGMITYKKRQNKWLLSAADFETKVYKQKISCSYYLNTTISSTAINCIDQCKPQQIIIEPISNTAAFNITKGIYADEHMLRTYEDNS